MSWGQLSFEVSAGDTILQVKQRIAEDLKIRPQDQVLFFCGKPLSDSSTLLSCGIDDNDVLRLICSGGNAYFLIPSDRFDSVGDNDYTSSWPQSEMRGGEPYYPPKGWRRYGLKVAGLSENDVWLGMSNQPGEWIVSYHGTSIQNVKGIVSEGYDLSKGRLFAYGKGVYSAQQVTAAEAYAKEFTWEGKKYRRL